jgi:hypothetical protein
MCDIYINYSYSVKSLLRHKPHDERAIAKKIQEFSVSLGLGRYNQDTNSFSVPKPSKNACGLLSHFVEDIVMITAGGVDPSKFELRNKDHIQELLHPHVQDPVIAEMITNMPIMLLFGIIGVFNQANKSADEVEVQKDWFPIGNFTVLTSFRWVHLSYAYHLLNFM